MFPFLSQLHEGRTGNHGNVGLLKSGYRDTLNYDGIAVYAIMTEVEFGVKSKGILGKANMDIILVKLW